jgi:diguanylate cyclase (GGDEF)-like protein/PAS domain S-box-containing protein
MNVPKGEDFAEQTYARVVFDTMRDGVVVVDDKSLMRLANPACEKMFGFPASDLLGRHISLVIPDWNDIETADGGNGGKTEGRRQDGSLFPVDLSRAKAAVDGAYHLVCVIHDLTQEELLRHDASIDPLTGVLNRRDLLAKSGAELERAGRYSHPCTVLMLDIDHFKTINDTFGHAEGDVPLQRFAAACEEILRKNDMFGRMGGEEFAIVLPETNAEGGHQLAERLRARVAEIEIAAETERRHMTVSIGLAEQASADDNIEVLLSRADRALYRAKQAGRNRVVVGTE